MAFQKTSELQQDKDTNFVIFCQAYPVLPVAISAYFTEWLPHTQLKANVRINKQMERLLLVPLLHVLIVSTENWPFK